MSRLIFSKLSQAMADTASTDGQLYLKSDDKLYLKTGSDAEVEVGPTLGFTSSQGTPTSNSLTSSSTDTKTGSVTLTLPAGKTWVWVKVTFATGLNTANCIQQFNLKIGASGGTLSYETGWDGLVHPRETTNNESDNITVSYTREGVPSVTDQSIDIETYSRLGTSFSTGDNTTFRVLYAVGQYK